MVQSFGVQIEGLPKAKKYMNNELKQALRNAQEGIKQAGFFIESEVKASVAGQRAEPASVDTGRFLGNIHTEIGDLKAVVATNLSYPVHLEYGTSKIAPRRHFGNTLTRNKQKVVEFVQKEVNKI